MSGREVTQPPSTSSPGHWGGARRRNTDAYNLDLSERRAKAVVDALTKRGIDRARLASKGFGKSKPVADNATAQGRSLNRRVEVSVVP
ncbi:MAG: OmpA family protein [Myxococcaceae bacterium]|nr:OmpA family protein [Myxococcaceae bacterium]